VHGTRERILTFISVAIYWNLFQFAQNIR